jgi:hypothetical protein
MTLYFAIVKLAQFIDYTTVIGPPTVSWLFVLLNVDGI